jgi:hypothetical protein
MSHNTMGQTAPENSEPTEPGFMSSLTEALTSKTNKKSSEESSAIGKNSEGTQ